MERDPLLKLHLKMELLLHVFYAIGFRVIMPIENLRIMILKGRSIWQKLEEKQL